MRKSLQRRIHLKVFPAFFLYSYNGVIICIDNKFSLGLSSLNIHYISIMKVSSVGSFRRLIRGLKDQRIHHDGYVGIYLWISATDTLQVLCFGFRGCKFIAPRKARTLCARWPF